MTCSARFLALALLLAASHAGAAPTSRELVLTREADKPLVGTLLVPENLAVKEPILVIAGSGPTDRDGNNPLGVTAAPYRLLAEALAARGVATLRTDKRGIGASRAALVREDDMTIDVAAADVRAWATLLREATQSRCAWLLGHSEGGLVALVAAARNPEVCGLILLSTPGRRVSDVMREQLRANPANAPILDEALSAVDALEQGRTVDVSTMHPALKALFRPSVQPYLISLIALDPVQRVRDYDRPVLVMQGTTDLQTTVQDARALSGARPGVALVLLDGVNHVLKPAPIERAANMAAYRDPTLPLAPGVADAVVRFVEANAASR